MKRLLAFAAPAIVCGSFVVGCGSATVEKPVVGQFGGDDPLQQIDFWHRLADEPVTSNDDAFHALLMFEGGTDPAADYAGRVKALKDKGLVANSFSQPATQGLDRGTLSVALAKALKIKGGILMSLFGPSPRYATKELEYAEVYPASSPNQTFSGSEFLAVMSRAEEYQRNREAGPSGTGGAGGGAGYVPPEMELKHGGGSRAVAPQATQPTGALAPNRTVEPAVPEATPAPVVPPSPTAPTTQPGT